MRLDFTLISRLGFGFPSRLLTYVASAMAAFVLVLGVSGCSSTLKKPKSKPAKLVALKKNLTPLQRLFSNRVGSGSTKDPLRLTPVKLSVNQKNYFAAASRSGRLALYNESGKTLWQKNLKTGITAGVSASSTGELVVADATGKVSAFSLDGKLKWQTQMTATVLAPALVTSNRVVVLANNGMVSGLDLAKGQVVWRFAINIPAFSLRGTAKPIALTDMVAVIAAADGRLHALRTDTGVPLWSRRVGISYGKSQFDRLSDTDADPVYFDKALYTASFQSQVLGMDMTTRKQMFQLSLSSTKTPALSEKHIFIVTTSGAVHAYNRFTGELFWKSNQLAHRGLSNPVVFGNMLFVGDNDGYIHSIDTQSGHVVGRVRSRGGVNTLALADDVLLCQTLSGVFSAWQIAQAEPAK